VTATQPLVGGEVLPALLLRAARIGWQRLPQLLLAGLPFTLAATAVTASALLGLSAGVLVGLPVLFVLATGIAAVVAREPRRALRVALLEGDAALGATLGLTADAALLLAGTGSAALIPACLLAALVLITAPFAIGYGALRGRRFLSALRGGLVLVALRPSWALSLLAISCLAAFAVAASAGVLILVVPALIAVAAHCLVGRLLAEQGIPESEPA
jgi:hypothetical protein